MGVACHDIMLWGIPSTLPAPCHEVVRVLPVTFCKGWDTCRAVYRNFANGGQIWGTYKRGGAGEAYYYIYEVLHPILARGGENDTRGGNAPPPSPDMGGGGGGAYFQFAPS